MNTDKYFGVQISPSTLKFVSKTRVSERTTISSSPPKLWLCIQCRRLSRSIPKPNSYTVSYLVNSLGFTPEKALKASTYLNFETPTKPESAIAFLKDHGFTETQISKLVKLNPRVLVSDTQNTLLPKINFFYSIGLTTDEITKMATSAPNILLASLDNQIIPTFNFFATVLQSNGNLLRAIKRFPTILCYQVQGRAAPNIQILKEVGMPEANILKLCTDQARAFTADEVTFRKIVTQVKELGFDPMKASFSLAIYTLRSMKKPVWDKKMKAYKKWGLSEDDIFVAFGRFPPCMKSSEDKIDKVMDFLVNKMRFDALIITKRPRIMSLSIEKRLIPRGFVYQLLLSKGLIEKKDCAFLKFLELTEMQFSRKLKLYWNQASELSTLYQQKLDLSK